MEQIPDDPIIAAMLRTGWPPWMLTAGADDDGLDQDPGQRRFIPGQL